MVRIVLALLLVAFVAGPSMAIELRSTGSKASPISLAPVNKGATPIQKVPAVLDVAVS